MRWIFLTRLLEQIHNHFIFRIWFVVLIVFRIVLIAVGGLSTYSDERSEFICNTQQPGCENNCYIAFTPLSHARFWVFQIALVATPSLLYLGYAANKSSQAEEQVGTGEVGGSQRKSEEHDPSGRRQHRSITEAEDDQEEELVIKESDGGGAVKENSGEVKPKVNAHQDGHQQIKAGGLMGIYVLQLLARSLVEVAFLCAQYALFGFAVPATYECSLKPCPHLVDCFIPRSTEKTNFLIIMFTVSLLCLALTITEMFYLGVGSICGMNRVGSSGGNYSSFPSYWGAPPAPPDFNIPMKPHIESTTSAHQQSQQRQNRMRQNPVNILFT